MNSSVTEAQRKKAAPKGGTLFRVIELLGRGQNPFALGGVLLLFRRAAGQSNRQGLVDAIHIMYRDAIELVLVEVFFDVLPILGGQDHVMDTGAFCRQYFFF